MLNFQKLVTKLWLRIYFLRRKHTGILKDKKAWYIQPTL